ncbi:MAG: serine/threonine protein kinase [Deltaproteobacteria bacterium]|nr:serine/threonine protein kinase [Deltaproteobacteria bacterium]
MPDRIGAYVIEELVGSGGMGVVYRGRDPRDGRAVAIKTLHAMTSDAISRERFAREIFHMSRISHPGVVRVLDCGTSAHGLPYYAMELLSGIDASSIVRVHGPQPAARVLHLLRQAAAALGEAHRHGMIHRDVSPSNVLACVQDGVFDVVKVIDFGLVKDLEGPSGFSLEGVVMGTPGYLPPESYGAFGRPDARTDVHMLAATGYYLLTACRPFPDSEASLYERARWKPVPPSLHLHAPVPADLEAVLLAALEPDPAHRPRDGAVLATALAACTDVPPWTQRDAGAWWANVTRR